MALRGGSSVPTRQPCVRWLGGEAARQHACVGTTLLTPLPLLLFSSHQNRCGQFLSGSWDAPESPRVHWHGGASSRTEQTGQSKEGGAGREFSPSQPCSSHTGPEQERRSLTADWPQRPFQRRLHVNTGREQLRGKEDLLAYILWNPKSMTTLSSLTPRAGSCVMSSGCPLQKPTSRASARSALHGRAMTTHVILDQVSSGHCGQLGS